MPQTKTDKILKKLDDIEEKIDYHGLSSIKLVLFSIGFGFLISSITVLFQSPKIISLFLFLFIMGLILICWGFFLPRPKSK